MHVSNQTEGSQLREQLSLNSTSGTDLFWIWQPLPDTKDATYIEDLRNRLFVTLKWNFFLKTSSCAEQSNCFFWSAYEIGWQELAYCISDIYCVWPLLTKWLTNLRNAPVSSLFDAGSWYHECLNIHYHSLSFFCSFLSSFGMRTTADHRPQRHHRGEEQRGREIRWKKNEKVAWDNSNVLWKWNGRKVPRMCYMIFRQWNHNIFTRYNRTRRKAMNHHPLFNLLGGVATPGKATLTLRKGKNIKKSFGTIPRVRRH